MAKRTGDIELAGVLTTPAGASSGLAGEDLSLTAGAGNTTGVGGNVILTSGAGGATSGVAGDIALTVGAVVSGDGGNITLSGGAGDAGGDITLTAGAGSVAAGGDVSITSGDSAGTIDGAQVSITSGAGGSTGVGGAGGPVTITAGAGAGTAGDGGNITLVAGAGSGTGSDGAVVIPDSTAPTAPANKLYSVGGVLSWNGTTLDTGGGGISAVVEDTTPQLGGALDGQGFAITDATYPATINAQVGVTYTAVLADADKIITLTNAAAIAMTIPANASVAYPIGTKLNFQQLGAGAVTVGITTDTLLINSGATLVMNGQNSIATALKITATEWVLFGQLVPAIAPLTSVAISDLDDGTDGELITWDAAGVATTVPAGTATQVLTSNGAGAEPTFQTVGVAGSAANLATTGADVNVDLAAPPTIGQTLVATSATTSTWQTPAAGGLANIVEDTTPQLGGILLVNDFGIKGNDFGSGGGQPIAVTLTGGKGGNSGGLGGDVDIVGGSAAVAPAGGGDVSATGGIGRYGFAGGGVVITGGLGGEEYTGNTGIGGDVTIVGGQGGVGATLGHGGDIILTPGTATGTGSPGAINITQTTAPDTTTNKLYNVAGALTWDGTDLTAGGGGISNVVEDTTPQLGGNLDVQTFSLITPYHPSPESIDLLPGNHVPGYAGEGGSVNLTAGDGHYLSGSGAGQINITGGADSGDATFSGHVNITGGTNSDYRGQGYGTGGDINLVGGIASGSSHAGDVFVQGGNAAGAGDGGDITLQSGTTSSGSTGAIVIPTQAAPTVTTNKLYNVAGALTWDGTDLTAGGGGISNVVEDTTPQLGGDLDVNGQSIIGADGVAATNPGAPIAITGGLGNTTGAGGAISITTGAGGVGNSAGGTLNLTAGDGGGYGGDVNITAGDIVTDGNGGNITLTPGAQAGGNSDGAVIITATAAPSVTTNKLYNVAGTLTWNGTDLTAGGDLIDDTTPQLGGALDTNGYAIVSANAATPNTIDITSGNATTATEDGGDIRITSGEGNTTGDGGFVAVYGGVAGVTGDGGSAYLYGGAGGATSGGGGDVIIVGGAGDSADTDGAIVLSTGAAGVFETARGYAVANSTGASALVATIPLTSGDSSVFEIFAVARQDSGTESAAFRIFGAAENTGGTAALIGSTAKDRTDDGGTSVDWDVVIGVSSGNLTITLDNDAETVDWKIKVRLTEL